MTERFPDNQENRPQPEIKNETGETLDTGKKRNIFRTYFEIGKRLLGLQTAVNRNGIILPARESGTDKKEIKESDEKAEILTLLERLDTLPLRGKILPEDLWITRSEYAAALVSDEARKNVQLKSQQALEFIARTHGPRSSSPISSFLSLSSLRQKDVQTLQESYIDIQRSLT